MKPIKKNNFGYLLSTCNNQLIKLLNRELTGAKLDLTREQFVVLEILWKEDFVSQQTLANELGKDKYSITKLIDGLEKRELVERVASKNDRREKLIKVTSKAYEIRPLVKETVKTTINKALGNIPENEIEITTSVMEKIIINIRE